MKFSTGSVLSRSLSVLFRNLISFFVIGLIVYIPLFVIGIILTSGVTSEDGAMKSALVIALLAMLLSFVVAGAVAYGVFQDLRGKRAGIGDCLSVGFSRMFPVIGVALLAGLATVAGLILLIVPGFIVLCMLYVAVPVAVVEKPGVMAALSRSADLTKGSRWSIFAIVLVISVASNIVGRIMNGAMESSDAVLIVILGVVVNLIFNLWSSVAQAVSYHDLRKEKEGIGIEDLVKVFD